MSELQAIESDAELGEALARVEEVFFAEEGTPEAQELEDLVSKIRAYEATRFPRKMPDPIEAIKFVIEQGAYQPEDLASSAIPHSDILEVLAGRMPLSFEMASTLSEQLAIPMELLWPRSENSTELGRPAKEAHLPALGKAPD